MLVLLESIFGTYSPVLTDVYNDAGEVIGEVVASGMAGVDWPYLSGVLIFCITLYSLFRIVGVFFK